MINKIKQAFSLVELMVTLVIVSCIISALAPAITKRLKSQGITIGSGGGGNTNLEFEQDCSSFGPDCALCFMDRCAMCAKDCAENEYVNTPDCSCRPCTNKSENCIECKSKGCIKCASGFGLLTTTKQCQKCEITQYTDGTFPCSDCPENFYCDGVSKVPCPTDSYSDIKATSCIACTTKWLNCATCNKNKCLTCKKGFKIGEDGNCKIASVTLTYSTPGEHRFTVPDGVEEIEVSLISGGAGGGAGATKTMTHTIVTSGTGNMTADENNLVTVKDDGVYTWIIPTFTVGKNFKITACGGGGGGAGYYSGRPGVGGHGAYIQNSVLKTQETSLIVQIGGGGGGGACNDGEWGTSGLCALGGGGGSSSGWHAYWSQHPSSCGSTSPWGYGGDGSDGNWTYNVSPWGGYDPVFNQHGQNGGTCPSGWRCAGGSYFGGGGGAGGGSYAAGGGGGATLFRHTTYALDEKLVAGGGSGGAGDGFNVETSCSGGAGGGITGASVSSLGNTDGVNGKNGVKGEETIFGANYCSGGLNGTCPGSRGKSGAMRLFYIDKGTTGGTGGGAGQIVPNQKVAVIPNEVLVITVGEGGAGGEILHYKDDATLVDSQSGKGANSAIISKITRESNGQVLLTTAVSITTQGATGGNSDGVTVGERGYITNGQNNIELTNVEDFSNTDGETANSNKGGLGGITTIGASMTHCSAGVGGDDGSSGSDATGYGGCGGGGGGAGGNGGRGASGYVEIKYGT